MDMFKGWFPFWATMVFLIACVTVVIITLPEPAEPFDIVGSLTPGDAVIIYKVSEADYY